LGPRVISISLAAAQSDALLDVCHNPSYSQSKMADKNLIDERFFLMKIS
jgi:hypothetical protein